MAGTSVKQKCMRLLFSHGQKVLLQVFLLATFFNFFGLPAITRFSKMEVMIVETTKETYGIPAPAITINVANQIDTNSCFNSNFSIDKCLEEKTLKRSDLLKSVILGFDRYEVNFTKENIREDFTSVWCGISYTLLLPTKIGPDYYRHQIFLELDTNLSYTVFIHDPDYFLFNVNPTVLPATVGEFTTQKEKPNSWLYKVQLTEVNKMNLPSRPCNDDHGYSFTSCLRRSIASKVQGVALAGLRFIYFWAMKIGIGM